MQAEPLKEHAWLQQFVGAWSYEVECVMGPGQPPMKAAGVENVRSIGGLWVVCEGRGEMPGGGPATTLMTLGYDPRTKRYQGTWVGSMMSQLWVYECALDEAGTVLTLTADGPSFTDDDKLSTYKDVIEIKSRDHRVMTSSVQGEDGQWQQFMTCHYRRTS